MISDEVRTQAYRLFILNMFTFYKHVIYIDNYYCPQTNLKSVQMTNVFVVYFFLEIWEYKRAAFRIIAYMYVCF